MDAVWMYHRFVSRRRPAMVVSAPADHDDQRDPEIDTFYLSEYHMQGARYHGGPSDEAYLKFIDTSSPKLGGLICVAIQLW